MIKEHYTKEINKKILQKALIHFDIDVTYGRKNHI